MEKSNKKFMYLLMAALPLVVPSCLKDKFQGSENVPASGSFPGFEFKTTKNINVNITLLNQQNQPVDGVLVELFLRNPLIGSGQKDLQANYKIFSGISDKLGKVSDLISTSAAADSLFVLVNYVGFPGLYKTACRRRLLTLQLAATAEPKMQDNY